MDQHTTNIMIRAVRMAKMHVQHSLSLWASSEATKELEKELEDYNLVLTLLEDGRKANEDMLSRNTFQAVELGTYRPGK